MYYTIRQDQDEVIAFWFEKQQKSYILACFDGCHGEACLEYYQSTKPATPEQVQKMTNLLESIGYQGLKFRKKLTTKYHIN